jgi:hypothetical protein
MLSAHVVSLEIPCICLPCNKLENDQDSDSDWFTYCIDIWLTTVDIAF